MGKKKEQEAIGMKYGRSDMIRIGLFSEPQYVSIGEAFNSKKNASSLDYRTKGKQFLTAPPKRGHDAHEAYFGKNYVRLFENEPYTDLVQMRRRWRNQAKDKNITSTPFKPSSVPPKPSGKGSIWGTIQQQWPMESKPFEAPRPIKEVKNEHEPKNFLTAPPKKGSGYGYPNVTIGKAYAYESDMYGRAEVLAKEERTENKTKMVGERPFISASSTKEFFNSFAGVTISPDEGKPEGAAKEGTEPQDKNDATKLPPIIPFKPTSCCGFTINPYPSYETPKEGEAPVKEAVRRDLIFRPSGVSGSYPIRSIIEVSCPLAPPIWMQESLRVAFTEKS